MIELNKIEVAVVNNGSRKLGQCYHQYDFFVYTRGNPDDKQYDDIAVRTSAQWRQELENMLPSANAGCYLGKFEKVEGTFNTWVARAWTRIDSGD